jgi:hypothetical protein
MQRLEELKNGEGLGLIQHKASLQWAENEIDQSKSLYLMR